MNFKNVPNKYRPIPFWSWNDKLEVEETKEQIELMSDVGIGGFFMHARGGLKTPYMEDEWYENVTASVESAKKRGMSAWAYDENGWPSGFGNGAVNSLGVSYQQKYLRMEDENNHPDTYIAKCGNHHFYYEINPFYVDTMDEKVIAKFIEVAYKPYFDRYKGEIKGLFTDEPQVSRNGLPWSFVFEKEYKERYNEDIKEHLEELFIMKDNYKDTRVKFWKMVTDLFSKAYMKQIYDACEENGFKFTGHLANETDFDVQIPANGTCMPHYEYFHIPGIDWLGRDIGKTLILHQLTSVCQQLGKKQVLTESFGLCGHNVSFAELKGILEWQMVRGVNLLCQHLEGYSIKGMRKRDYPPAVYKQQPWWSEYKNFIDAMSRVGMILAEGECEADVLLIHPMTTVWTYYDEEHMDKVTELNEKLVETMNLLESKHITFHLGDESIIERYGSVENNKFIVGNQKYSYVITSECEVLFKNTENLLKDFKNNGGRITTANEIQTNDITDNKKLTYTKRIYENCTIHYFVNSSAERFDARINAEGKKLDIYSGECEAFSGVHNFEPWGSLMIIDDGTKNIAKEETVDLIKLNGEFNLQKGLLNTLTLDHCDYYFDGVLQEKNGYVLNICERATALEKKIKLHQDYYFKADYKPETLFLVCETPEKFLIKVNDAIVKYNSDGYFVDKSFKKIDIAQYVCEGENKITFDCDFKQSEEFYESMKKAYKFESEKNKLAYDMEIESIYILGDFSVRTDGIWDQLNNNASRYKGNFVIDKPVQIINLKHIEKQGYPFFCGEMVLTGKIDITGKNPVLELDIKGVNAVRIEINGITKVMINDNRLSLKEFGADGATEIKITLINNLRNLLGPHHLEVGESYRVGPGAFYKEFCVWKRPPEKGAYYDNRWNEDYCFAEMSV